MKMLLAVLLALLPVVAFAEDFDTGEPCPSGLDEVGRCEGQEVWWCEDDTLHKIECDLFQVCTFSAADGYYDCAEDTSGSGTCVGHCGEKTEGGCWCDTTCASNGDCCEDICAACGFCGGSGGEDAGSGGTGGPGGADVGSGSGGSGADSGSSGADAGSGGGDAAGASDAKGSGSGSHIGNPYGTNGPSAYPSGGSRSSGCNAGGGAPLPLLSLVFLALGLFGLRGLPGRRRGLRG
jgi:hypothetical protein